MYDVTNVESFHHVEDWLAEVNRYANENTTKLLIGNKADMTNKAVTPEMVTAFSDKLKIPSIETSAKASNNVDAAFLLIARDLIKAK